MIRLNKAGEEFLGISRDELAGKTDYDIFPSEQADANVKADRKVIVEKRMIAIAEAKIYSKTKGDRLIYVRKIPLFNDKGEVAFILGIAEDITEQKKLAEDNSRLQHQLWQSQKLESIGRFAGSIAHDFNNHLSVIMGYANLLLDTMGSDDPKRADVLEIYRAGESAAMLSKQLLTFSRKQVLQCVNVDLNKVLRGLQRMLRRLVSENISLEFMLPTKPTMVWADPSQMEQVIMNLVVNSRDAMPAGGRLAISVERQCLTEEQIRNYEGKPGNYIVLTVADTGMGMDSETISHVFEPFYTTKEVGKGVGLGLATVYGIVKQSDGFVRVESSVGAGTTMRIFLPESKEAGDESGTKREMTDITSRGGSETILIVEDDEAVLGLIEKILVPAGYRVVIAKCCADAEQQLHSNGRIDALLCDVVLPDGKGNEFYARMKKQYPDLRVIFMSGYGDEAISKEITRMKHAKMILKPFSSQDLKAHIRSLLEH